MNGFFSIRAVFLKNEPKRESFFCLALACIWRAVVFSFLFAVFGAPSFGKGFNCGKASTLGREDIESEDAVFAAAAGAAVATGPECVVADKSPGELPGTSC